VTPPARRFGRVCALVLALVLGVVTGALAGPPSDQLKVGIDKVIHVLADPTLKGTAKAKQRRDTLREITGPLFDWNEMASRSLGQHWQSRTEAERQEFVRLFHDLLERSYFTTVERYNGERVTYGTEALQGEQATVRTQVLNKAGQQFPIDYRLIRRGDRWLVYDVLIEGVSLVANYRAQFDQIIRTSSFEKLVDKLKSSS
jgi:phospholipid transport system substrate-binding protein